MTAHLPADRPSDHPAVTTRPIAEIAAVAAEFLRLAARTGVALETLPPDEFEKVERAVQDAVDAARHVATLLVDAGRSGANWEEPL